MLQIKKMRANPVFDFAAQELKKYLRMMMPEAGDIEILLEEGAKDGFRLGLLEDFGLSTEEVDDPLLDDVIHVETTEEGGILAGSNPRSVLFAVYRFLRENGCRWLYPGIDGEYVPMQDIVPISYHKKADHRFRGHCNEGAESQTCMLETIDFYAKQEINVYMLEFSYPLCYYEGYYKHKHNEKNRIPEPITKEQVLQWKRQCEVEIAKRGLMFHDMGHGWTLEPFGIPITDGWDRNAVPTEEQRQYLALMNGSRGYNINPLATNFCYSQPKVRTLVAKTVANYAENHQNVTYLHVWLADAHRNHCECEECQKMRPSDWYVMMLNEIDEELSRKGLDTRIVFCAYRDTMFAPETQVIKNPKRFSLLYGPVFHSYSYSITEESKIPEPLPYVRNAWTIPKENLSEMYLAWLRDWKKTWKGPCLEYEYHFWRVQGQDPAGMSLARRIHEDVRSLKIQGLEGCIEDGSQRSFFPNGFAIYMYAETMMNRDCDFEKVAEDYFSHVYGEDWKTVMDILDRMSQAFDFKWLLEEKSKNIKVSKLYNPDQVEKLDNLYELCARERAIAEQHLNMPTRPQTVSYRLLLRHAEFCERLTPILQAKARGYNEKAREMAKILAEDFGKYEIEIERYYDHALAFGTLFDLLRKGGDMLAIPGA